MKRIKHLVIALAAIIGVCLILVAAATFLVPQLLNRGALGKQVRREISSHVEGDFNFDRIDVAVFPFPHAVLIKPRLTIPERFSASVETIEMYPDIISSLTGHIAVNKVAVKRPEFTIWIDEQTDSTASPACNPMLVMY